MKTIINKSIRFLLLAMIMVGTVPSGAQSNSGNDGYITVNGVVKNLQNKKKVEYANVGVKGSNIGTITNDDGEFTLKIKKSLNATTIVVSHIGYISSQLELSGGNENHLVVLLTPRKNMLDEIVVEATVSRGIVKEAIRRISQNYEDKNSMLTGFYREIARKRNHYINISEAVVNLYKTAYTNRTADNDRVHIIKGRKLLSEKSSDTLAVRLLGGPNLSLYIDLVKNPDDLLDDATLGYYDFMIGKSIYIDNRMQYVISFRPIVSLPYALCSGKLYIDKESFAFTRIELSLDMSDRNKVTQTILKKKPMGLIFKPQELTFLINYKERNGKMCLSYIRNEIKFKCDWKKKLFHTNYGIVSEMVITDMNDSKIDNISYRDSFKDNDSFTDKVTAFDDDGFWGAYNILAPTESLDKAVNKLMKQYMDSKSK